MVRIGYGLPSDELIEVAKSGEIVLGGCNVGFDRWYCKKCERGFKETDPQV